MNLLGVSYFTDSILNAMTERMQTEAYRVYETDCLFAIARYLGIKLEKRYYGILHPAEDDPRTGMEIAEERLERFGIEVID